MRLGPATTTVSAVVAGFGAAVVVGPGVDGWVGWGAELGAGDGVGGLSELLALLRVTQLLWTMPGAVKKVVDVPVTSTALEATLPCARVSSGGGGGSDGAHSRARSQSRSRGPYRSTSTSRKRDSWAQAGRAPPSASLWARPLSVPVSGFRIAGAPTHQHKARRHGRHERGADRARQRGRHAG